MPGRATPDAAVGDMRFEHLHDVLGVGVAHSRLSRILSESVWSAVCGRGLAAWGQILSSSIDDGETEGAPVGLEKE